MAYKKMNKEELVTENRRYVEAVAKQYLNQGLTLEQLIEEGNKGLVAAAERYDANKGYKFISYAVWLVRMSILQALAAVQRGEPIPEKYVPREFKGKDPNYELLEKLCNMKCIIKDKTLDDNMHYGTFQDLDEMVDSTEVRHRIRIASLGYGLDKLKDDPDPLVRVEVAKLGYYRSQFIQDPSPIVRKAVESWEEE